MEWLNVIVTAICSLLAALGGGSVIYFKQNRQMKEVEVQLKKQERENNEIKQWQEIVADRDKQIAEVRAEKEKVKGECDRLSEKISRLYEERNREHDDAMFYSYAITHILSGQFYCEVRGCNSRKPLNITEGELEEILRNNFGLIRANSKRR